MEKFLCPLNRREKLIVRMKKHDNQNWNFVHVSMIFIAENLLIKAKRYISKNRKNLLICLLEKRCLIEKRGCSRTIYRKFLTSQNRDKK